jgi:hypothetical protein
MVISLAVYIVSDQFALLKSRETDLELFIEELVKHSHDEKSQNRLDVTLELVDDLLESMDTSWDRKNSEIFSVLV